MEDALFMAGEENPIESDDDDVDDNIAHTKLLNEVAKLSGKKRNFAARNVRASTSSASSIKKLNLIDEIINKNKTSIKKVPHEIKPLEKQLEKPAANRIRRAVGFDNVCMEVNKWEKLVHQRRKADQLKFPLHEVDVRLQTVEKLTEDKPKNNLQKRVYGLLTGANYIEKKKETEEERNLKKAMSLKEIKERNREIWRLKLQQQKSERKAAFQNSSKSRKYHKILRKERLRKQRAEVENLTKSDPEAALEKISELEDIRIKERMSLRHKRSKWAHLQGLRAKHDKNSLLAVEENKKLHQDLTQKLKVDNNKSDDSDDCDDKEIEEMDVEGDKTEKESFTKLKKLWDDINKEKAKMQKDDAFEKEMNKSAVEIEHTFISEQSNENIDEVPIGKGNDVESDKSAFSILSKDASEVSAGSKKVSKKPIIDPTAFMKVKSKNLIRIEENSHFSGQDVLDDDDDDENPEQYIQDALADDYLVEEFKNEKQDTIKKNKINDINLAMPGWGSWAGSGIEVSKRKAKRMRIKAPVPPPRKDSNIGNVIYNEELDVHENLRKVMVSNIPFPFTSVKDFEASIRAPIGRTFVPENVHRKLIAPPIVTKLGTVIQPMDEDSLLKTAVKDLTDDTKEEKKDVTFVKGKTIKKIRNK